MSDFNRNSPDAMFATILLRLDQQDKDRLKDVQERTDFRALVVDRFDRGSQVMEALGTEIAAVKEQTLKTNGRVTKLEGKWKQVTAQIAGALVVLGGLWRFALWLYDHGFRITH